MVTRTTSEESPMSQRFDVILGSFAFCPPVHKESRVLRSALMSLLPVALFAQQSSTADSGRLHQLFAQRWEYTMREYPEFATSVGYPGQNARWADYSLEAIA